MGQPGWPYLVRKIKQVWIWLVLLAEIIRETKTVGETGRKEGCFSRKLHEFGHERHGN